MSSSINPTFACLAIKLEREAHGAAAVDPGGGVLTGAIAAAVVHCTRFWQRDRAQVSPGKLQWQQETSWDTRHSPKHTAVQTFSLEHTAKYMCWQNPCLSYFQAFCGNSTNQNAVSGYSICVLNPCSLMMNQLLPVSFLMSTVDSGCSPVTSPQ